MIAREKYIFSYYRHEIAWFGMQYLSFALLDRIVEYHIE